VILTFNYLEIIL